MLLSCCRCVSDPRRTAGWCFQTAPRGPDAIPRRGERACARRSLISRRRRSRREASVTSRGPGGSAIRLRCERCGNEESPNPGGSSAEGAEVAFKANDVIGRRLGEDEDTTLPLCAEQERFHDRSRACLFGTRLRWWSCCSFSTGQTGSSSRLNTEVTLSKAQKGGPAERHLSAGDLWMRPDPQRRKPASIIIAIDPSRAALGGKAAALRMQNKNLGFRLRAPVCSFSSRISRYFVPDGEASPATKFTANSS